MFVVFLSFFVLSCLGQPNPVTFLPTEYSSQTPFQFDVERNTFAIQVDICNESLYNGCNFTAVLNLPFTGWSMDDGTFITFQVGGIADGCLATLCRNNPAATTNPNTCSFIYQQSYGSKLYIYGSAGRSAGFQSTFNMKVNCAPRQPYVPITEPRPKAIPTACPIAFSPSKRGARLVVPGDVQTSPTTALAKKYYISVCSTNTPYAKLTFTLQASDQKSAFATYFCSVSNCNTLTSPIGWYDNTGTATNLVKITNLQKNLLLYFTIYGWGQYQDKNEFVFNIHLTDQS